MVDCWVDCLIVPLSDGTSIFLINWEKTVDPSLDLEDLKLFIFIFFMQKNIYLYKKWKQFCKKNAKKYERKIIIIWPSDLGRWDDCSSNPLTQYIILKIVRIYDILGCRVTQVSKWVAGLDLGQSKLGTSDAWLIRQSTQHIILKIVRFVEDHNCLWICFLNHFWLKCTRS